MTVKCTRGNTGVGWKNVGEGTSVACDVVMKTERGDVVMEE